MGGKSLKFKLFSAFLCIQFAIFIFGLSSLRSMTEMREAVEPITSEVMPKAKIVSDMRGLFREIRIQIRSLGMEGLSAENVSSYEAATVKAVEGFQTAMLELEKLHLTEEEKAIYSEVKIVLKRRIESIDHLSDLTPEFKKEARKILHCCAS